MSTCIYTTRHIPLASDLGGSARNDLLTWLGEIKGIKVVSYDEARMKLVVEYDLLCMNFNELLRMLRERGAPIRQGMWFSLLSGWLSYIDRTAKTNASAPPPSCCNRPPPRIKR
jgi:hypothetical protein